jgi:hypothetical protein
MRGPRSAIGGFLTVVLALAATQAMGKPGAQPGFAEPSDIIAAESSFTHLSAAKGLKTAIRATAVPDAQIYAPQLLRVTDYANLRPSLPATWHTGQVWMSCDGSAAVSHGTWQRGPALGWYITVWRRQKKGNYQWVLEQGGPLVAAPDDSDMIAASVADCPARRARGSANTPPASSPGKVPAADYTSGHADDSTLAWATTFTADGGRTFTLQIKQDGILHEVLRTAAPSS